MGARYLLPLASAALLTLAIYQVFETGLKQELLRPGMPPPQSMRVEAIAANGVVEAGSANIAVAAPWPGVANAVLVEVNGQVRKGQPLFRLDDRALRAELAVRDAACRTADAQLARLDGPGRRWELTTLEKRARRAADRVHNEEAGVREVGNDADERIAEQSLDTARADADRLQGDAQAAADTWAADKAVALATRNQARAAVEQARLEVERACVLAPMDGVVLQVNIRPGEYVGPPPLPPPIVLGHLGRLQVRVEVDEHDLARFRPGATAWAQTRGAPGLSLALQFLHVEPLVIPKKALSGEAGERVDTRVLPVIYAVELGGPSLYVGQQVDVFIAVGE
jgi:multidrug resistance efflux pump